MRMTIEYTYIREVYIVCSSRNTFFFNRSDRRGTGQEEKKLKRLKTLREELQQWTNETHSVA